MALIELRPGSKVDLINQHEMSAALDVQTRNWFQERARGISTAPIEIDGAVASGALSLPSTGQDPIGPKPGMVWAIQRLSMMGLTGSDVLNVYRSDPGSVAPKTFLGPLTVAAPVLHIGKLGMVLRGGQRLAIVGTSLTTTNGTTITINGDAEECSELDFYKLI